MFGLLLLLIIALKGALACVQLELRLSSTFYFHSEKQVRHYLKEQDLSVQNAEASTVAQILPHL